MKSILDLLRALGLFVALLPLCGCMRTVGVEAVKAEMLYLTYGGALQVFSANPSTGTIEPVGSAAFPDNPAGVVVDPKSRFLYVSDFNANSVYAFSIDANSGALAPIVGSPFPFPGLTGGNGGALAMDPKGRFVFFTNDTGNIATFLIDPATGSLTPSPTVRSEFPIIDEMIVEPSGQFLYLADHDFPQFWAYSIDQSTGGLTLVSGSPFTFTTLGGPGAMGILGSYLYAPYSFPKGIFSLNINQSTGALTAVGGSPFPNQSYGTSVAFDPTGKSLYVGNTNTGSISAYTIDASNGALTELTSSPYNGFGPLGLAVDPSGKFLFISQSFPQNQILAFGIDPSTGAINRGPTFTFPNSVFLSPYMVMVRLP